MECAFCGKSFTGRKRKYCTKDCLTLAFGKRKCNGLKSNKHNRGQLPLFEIGK